MVTAMMTVVTVGFAAAVLNLTGTRDGIASTGELFGEF
jgi:hypothetical protein